MDPWSYERGVDKHAPVSVAPPGAVRFTRASAGIPPTRAVRALLALARILARIR
jgi:hypothetical protein